MAYGAYSWLTTGLPTAKSPPALLAPAKGRVQAGTWLWITPGPWNRHKKLRRGLTLFLRKNYYRSFIGGFRAYQGRPVRAQKRSNPTPRFAPLKESVHRGVVPQLSPSAESPTTTGPPGALAFTMSIHEEFTQVIAGTLTLRANLFGDNDIGFRYI